MSHTLGSSGKLCVHTIHDEFAHSVTGLRQSGHCSAPMVISVPPTGSHLLRFLNALM